MSQAIINITKCVLHWQRQYEVDHAGMEDGLQSVFNAALEGREWPAATKVQAPTFIG